MEESIFNGRRPYDKCSFFLSFSPSLFSSRSIGPLVVFPRAFVILSIVQKASSCSPRDFPLQTDSPFGFYSFFELEYFKAGLCRMFCRAPKEHTDSSQKEESTKEKNTVQNTHTTAPGPTHNNHRLRDARENSYPQIGRMLNLTKPAID